MYMQVCSTIQAKFIHSKYVLSKLDCVELNYYFPHISEVTVLLKFTGMNL